MIDADPKNSIAPIIILVAGIIITIALLNMFPTESGKLIAAGFGILSSLLILNYKLKKKN